MLKVFRVQFFFLTLFFLTGCNHLFYYPHRDIYMTPERVKLTYEDLKIPSTDQVILQGWHIKPKQKAKGVAVLQFHGNAENRSTHFLSVGWLSELGADVVVFDYRGYNGSTGEPSRKGLVDDGIAILNWFQKKFPNSRRFVIGQSLGGAVVVPSLARSPESVHGLILESTFDAYRSIARRKLAGVWLTWPFQWLPWLVLSGSFDPVDDAPNIAVPALCFHDRDDPVVPWVNGESLYKALPKHQTRYFITEGNRHVSAMAQDRPESRDKILEFLGLSDAL